MPDSIAHCAAYRHAGDPEAGGFGLARIVADAVRSGRHGPAFRPDAQSGARRLKVPGAVP
ncbi:hypothetical protein D7207_00645 [Burkholderia cepacia]|uniref:hypothetical protein n=1 Tax=Burkholderia cepacia TaxID=292 RepID=UPI0005B505BE|nr:hypothetical protein [Burkholderia cepacia]AOI82369.1 hypothetical protein WI67_07865 [Burkholderia cepacia]MBA9895427.1 hypothetical protein [Burkholderia cepacia]MBA9941962.1 hypothetical protein [Burkholderia cepacia]MBA9972309.1 hypothetical protein [Burkholderia cepacia]MBA9990881.1 hypothetical protein [Burkholderia cepacia]